MEKSLKVSILGAGNVASNLATAFEENGIQVAEIYARKLLKAQQLTEKLYATRATDQLDFSKSEATIFFIALSDHAIQAVCTQSIFPTNAIIVHCSGTQPLTILQNFCSNYGVFYPVQTFTKGSKISFLGVPICIEGVNHSVENILQYIAKQMGCAPCFMDSIQRKYLHLAAVIANNFSTHLLTIAEKILIEEGLVLSLIQPLMLETLSKTFKIGPSTSQTGPAIRGDYGTIEEHRSMLEQHPKWKDLYELMTFLIAQEKS